MREVRGLRIFRRVTGASEDWREVPDPAGVATATLDIAGWQLPELLGVVVTDDPSGAPTRMTARPNPYADPRAVAVPVEPKVC